MRKIGVNWSEQSRKRRHEQNDDPAARKNRRHIAQRKAIVFDMFENVHADAAIGSESRECGEIRAIGAADECMQIRLVRKSRAQTLHALGLDIDCDDKFAIEQFAGEIASAASNLNDAPAQFRKNQARLPREVIRGVRHQFLIGQRVCGAR